MYGRFEEVRMNYDEENGEYEPMEGSDFDQSRPSTSESLIAHSHEMINQPSLDFSRQQWWDSLTRSYGPDRATSTRRIMEDISHLYAPFYSSPLFGRANRTWNP